MMPQVYNSFVIGFAILKLSWLAIADTHFCQSLPPPCSGDVFLVEDLLQQENPNADDGFARDGAMWHDFTIIGVDYDDNFGSNSGAAVLFHRTGDAWEVVQEFTAFDANNYDVYGRSVDIHEDLIVIGAPLDDDCGSASGSVYVYRQSETEWLLEAKLTPNPCSDSESFGSDVAVFGNLIAVGAPTNAGSGPGAVFAFSFDGTNWNQEGHLTAIDGLAGHEFGRAVATDGSIIVAGAWFDNHAGIKSGSAWIFRKGTNGWQTGIKLVASDATYFDRFGSSVSVASGRIVVGAYTEDPGGIMNAGSVYVFDEFDGQWIETAKLAASDGGEYDEFGWRVSIHEDGDMVAVGSIRYEDEKFDLMFDQGAVYLYRHINGNWTEVQQLVLDNPSEWDLFGYTVSLSCNALLVGMPQDDSAALDAGSAIVYVDMSEQTSCEADINQDGFVNIDDLLAVIGNYGSSGPIGDIDGDCSVTVEDLLLVIKTWGACD